MRCVPPTFGATSYSFSVPWDSAIGTVVGSVSATGSETDDTVTYSIPYADENGRFAIDASTGQITVAGNLASAAGTPVEFKVEAGDERGGRAWARVTVAVTQS